MLTGTRHVVRLVFLGMLKFCSPTLYTSIQSYDSINQHVREASFCKLHEDSNVYDFNDK